MCIAITCFPVNDIISCETNLSFLIKPFYCATKKVNTKSEISIKRTERASKIKKKTFSPILKGFDLQKTDSDPGVGP